jgi:hypothetical protein
MESNSKGSARIDRFETSSAFPVLLGLAAAACFVLAFRRVLLNLSFSRPLQMLTTGLEEEALFSIWKFIHGQAVYSDPFAIPFAASYFNWLFYSAYGFTSSVVMELLGLNDEWLPTVTHSISLFLGLLCIPASTFIVRDLVGHSRKRRLLLGLGVGLLVAFNPLSGWWTLSARPDIGALLLEVVALFLCLRYVRSGSLLDLFATVSVAYLAWSFRQTAVSVISGLCLFLILRSRWGHLALAAGSTLAMYLATFRFGGAEYWSNTVVSTGATRFIAWHGFNNFMQAGRKSPLLLCGFVAFAVLMLQIREKRARPDSILLAASWAFSLCWSLATSMKVGASDNYFISSTAIGLFFAISVASWAGDSGTERRASGALLAAVMTAQVVSCLAVLGGAAGRLDLREDEVPTLALKRVLAGSEGPILATDRWLNLPWINPGSPSFVFAYVYRSESLQQGAYEGGGLEGLIDRQYFRRIVVPKGSSDFLLREISERYRMDSQDRLFIYYTPVKKDS